MALLVVEFVTHCALPPHVMIGQRHIPGGHDLYDSQLH